MFFFHINSEHFEVDLHLFKENSIKKVIKSGDIHVIIVSQIHGINLRQDAYSLSLHQIYGIYGQKTYIGLINSTLCEGVYATHCAYMWVL